MTNPLNIWMGYEAPAVALAQIDDAIMRATGAIDRTELALALKPQLKDVEPWCDGDRWVAARAIIESRLIKAFKAGHVGKVIDHYGRHTGWKRLLPKWVRVDGKWVKAC